MICQVCNKTLANQIHHKLSQTKMYKRLYGDLIHDLRNQAHVCADCHMTKPIPKFTERQFCEALGITPRSKTERGRA